jgi:hypothetical protein
MLWRRVDTPGHEACRLEQRAVGWRLAGTSIYRHDDGSASIAYSVLCDTNWQTVSGRIRGVVGQRRIDYFVARHGAVWTLNDVPMPGLEHLHDLDLSFTPATIMQQLRRVTIANDEAIQLPVAWLDVDAGTLTELPQIYVRRGEATFWYRAPTVGYEGLLELSQNGFIRSYPNLWEAEQVS